MAGLMRSRPVQLVARGSTYRTLSSGWPPDATGVALGSAALLVCLSVGFLLPLHREAAFLVLLLSFGIAALGAPATYWVIAALATSFMFQGLTTVGLLPSLGTVVPIALSWGAFGAAVLKKGREGIPDQARPHLRWLIALACIAIVSGLFNHVEILRPFLSLGLLGVPYVLLAAILIDPPDARQRQTLLRVTMGLVLLQIPVVFWQLALGGGGNHGASDLHAGGDRLQGTFISRGGGSGVVGAIAVITAIWLLARRRTPWNICLAAVLLVFPFITDTKQVIFALPAASLLTAPQGLTRGYFVRNGLAIGLVALLLLALPGGQAALGYIHQDQQRGGQSKVQVGRWLWRKLESDPISLTVGKGPAETVSLSAYYTTPGFLSDKSPLKALGLAPAPLAITADYLSYGVVDNSVRSSFQSPISSALGVLGDFGLAGALIYAILLATVFRALAKSRSPEGIAALAGLALFAVLGFVYDWWEAPGLPAFVGVLAGVALTEGGPPRQAWLGRPTRRDAESRVP